jgi:hypothetical protein
MWGGWTGGGGAGRFSGVLKIFYKNINIPDNFFRCK